MSSGERPIGAAKGKQSDTEALCQPPPPPAFDGCTWSTARATAPSPGRPTPRVVKQDTSSGGSVDTTKTRSDPQRVRMSSGERPIGAAKGKQSDTEALCQPPPPPPAFDGCTWSTARATAPSPGRPTPGVVKQDTSSGGSVDTTKTRSDPQRVRMSSGERPIGAAKGKQSDTEALCHPPPPPAFDGCTWSTARATAPSPGRPTPGVVKQDTSSGGSVDTTKTRSDPQRVRMSSGERPIGAAQGKQSDTEALCPPPPPHLVASIRRQQTEAQELWSNLMLLSVHELSSRDRTPSLGDPAALAAAALQPLAEAEQAQRALLQQEEAQTWRVLLHILILRSEGLYTTGRAQLRPFSPSAPEAQQWEAVVALLERMQGLDELAPAEAQEVRDAYAALPEETKRQFALPDL